MIDEPRIYPLFGNGRYRVWAHGQVDGLRSGEWRTLRPHVSEYANFNLCYERTKRTASMHRMVAVCFIPNPLGLGDVNHKDGNKKNSCAENLEWCTRLENMRHYYAGRRAKGLNRHNTRITDEDAIEMRCLHYLHGLNQRELCERYGMRSVQKIIDGRNFRDI